MSMGREALAPGNVVHTSLLRIHPPTHNLLHMYIQSWGLWEGPMLCGRWTQTASLVQEHHRARVFQAHRGLWTAATLFQSPGTWHSRWPKHTDLHVGRVDGYDDAAVTSADTDMSCSQGPPGGGVLWTMATSE